MIKGSNRGQKHIYVLSSNFGTQKLKGEGKNFLILQNISILWFLGKLKAIFFTWPPIFNGKR
jgi:hypothetical protein